MFAQLLAFISEHLLFLGLHLESGSFPKPLSARDAADCLERAVQGDKEVCDTLVKHNLRLVAHIAKKYYQSSADSDDLISIGTIGLIKAVNSFHVRRGTRFSTYASKCIENEILMELRTQKKTHNGGVMQDPLGTDGDGNSLFIADVVGDDGDFCGDVEKQESLEKLRLAVQSRIFGRDRRIIAMRFGLFGFSPHTQQQVADLLGISRSYVSRIEKRVLDELRAEIEK